MRRQRLFLDANILVSARFRDLLLRVADAGLIEVRWSQQVIDEARRALTDRLGLDPVKVDQLLDRLAGVFPEALIEGFEHRIDKISLPDANDRHVLAAAVHGECDQIVTNNLRDFPESTLAPYDVGVMDTDECLSWLAQFGDRLAQIIDQQIADLRRPPSSVVQFLEQLRRDAPNGAVILGAVLRHDRYRVLLPKLLESISPESPNSAVHELIALVSDPVPADDLLNRIHRDFAIRPEENVPWDPQSVHDALRAELRDVLSNPMAFGVGSALRLVDLDVETVAILRRSPTGTRIAREPHLYLVMRLFDQRWQLVAIDRPPTATVEKH